MVWTNLTDHFESKSVFSVFNVQQQLAHLTLQEKDDAVVWLRKRMELYEQLSVLGEEVPDKQPCMTTLALLPESYKPLYTLLMTQLAAGTLSMKQLIEFVENYKMG